MIITLMQDEVKQCWSTLHLQFPFCIALYLYRRRMRCRVVFILLPLFPNPSSFFSLSQFCICICAHRLAFASTLLYIYVGALITFIYFFISFYLTSYCPSISSFFSNIIFYICLQDIRSLSHTFSQCNCKTMPTQTSYQGC